MAADVAHDSVATRRDRASSSPSVRVALSIVLLVCGCVGPSAPPPARARGPAPAVSATNPLAGGRKFQPPVVGTLEKQDRVRVRFEGNHFLSAEELLDVVRVDEADDFAPPVPPLSDIAEIDQLRILSAYFEHGFVRAESIGAPRIETQGGVSTVVFRVVEGERYMFGKVGLREVDAAGKDTRPLRPKAKLLELLSVSTGSLFVRSELAASVGRVRRLYADEGFAYVDVLPETRTDDDARTVDVDITIRRGEVAHVDEVEVVGATQVDPAWIQATIGLRPGDRYRESRLESAKEALTASGRFRAVDVSFAKAQGNNVRIVFELQE